jgi:thioredoxin reductase (NADPH)
MERPGRVGVSWRQRLSCSRWECEKRPHGLVLENGKPLEARSVVLASRAQYNNLDNLNLERFVGQDVYYGATFTFQEQE